MTREQLRDALTVADAHRGMTKPTAVVCLCGARWPRGIQPTDAEWAAIDAAWREHRLDAVTAALAPKQEGLGL